MCEQSVLTAQRATRNLAPSGHLWPSPAAAGCKHSPNSSPPPPLYVHPNLVQTLPYKAVATRQGPRTTLAWRSCQRSAASRSRLLCSAGSCPASMHLAARGCTPSRVTRYTCAWAGGQGSTAHALRAPLLPFTCRHWAHPEPGQVPQAGMASAWLVRPGPSLESLLPAQAEPGRGRTLPNAPSPSSTRWPSASRLNSSLEKSMVASVASAPSSD